MDDMIKEKLALKQQIDSLEQNLSNQIKENESLLQTFTVFKNESKEKESKYLDKEINLEKKIKELDNIVYKEGQSAQTVHMLTKPQVFYDDTHKQALGYQNSFYLKKAQRIKPTLYDGSVISSQHVASPVIDDEETLILEEVSRSKMLAKQNDPISKEKKVNTTPHNYIELNRLSKDFGKRFVPQQELSDEQAFWLQTSHPKTDQYASSPVKIEAPREVPKVSLVNTSLKKLKYHLGQFDVVVKKRITPDAITEGEGWKETVENDAQIQIATVIALGMFKIDLEPLAPRLLNNRDTHIDFLKHTQEQADILQGIVEQAKAKQLLDNALDITCKHAKRIQELLVYVRDTCPNDYTPRLKCSNSTCRSRLTSNKRNDRILQTPSSNIKNKVEVQCRRVKSKSNKTNRVKDLIFDSNAKHTMLNANSELIYVKCNQCMFDANHDVCFLDFVNDVNVRSKSKSAMKSQHHNIWKPTGKVLTEVGHKWKPTGRLFTIVGNSCPLTRITPKKIVNLKETTSNSVETPILEIKVYSRRPKQIKSVGVDLLLVSRDINLYTISLDDMLKTSPICPLSKASKTKSWLWNRRLSHLNFACALGKSKKSSHQPKFENTNQEKLYLLHMDLCGPMHVESINGKKYILVIVDDYSRFTWVKFLRLKDEAPDAIIK
ncbi:retrovirus-related pol polyprotein from transposon TNT 1-94 [Tanacetum coccineum]|uniref:Retrovirus-related pol polyprotein from transposon TNT 1-94 n=1 Tax=Tanacetum coccineum TaxID=301880 RepID=A0ABQ5AGG6_9ASTR